MLRKGLRFKGRKFTILGIESSCDETGAAVVEGCGGKVKILSNVVGSQVKLHQRYGGVVPELAARRHADLLIPVLEDALGQVSSRIDAVAVTNGPGLMVALLVGVQAAKALAYAWNKPLIGVNHLAGHIYSILSSGLDISFFDSPSIALIVSGGHTELVLIRGYGDYQVLGRTCDDAAGEAFDKVAKILELSYPGGPAISKAARHGSKDRFDMPRPMIESGDLSFSFAGIKTHILYLVNKIQSRRKGTGSARHGLGAYTAHIAASFQEAVVDVLVAKTIAAALYCKVKNIIIVGGVSANERLREKMADAAKIEDLNCYFPPMCLTGDNAAMIGIAGYIKACYNQYDDIFSLQANPNLSLDYRPCPKEAYDL